MIGNWIYQRCQVSGLVGKRGGSSEEEWKVASLC